MIVKILGGTLGGRVGGLRFTPKRVGFRRVCTRRNRVWRVKVVCCDAGGFNGWFVVMPSCILVMVSWRAIVKIFTQMLI